MKTTIKNPVLERELSYQHHLAVSPWQRHEPLIVGILVIVLLVAIALTDLYNDPFSLLFIIWGFHFLATLRIIMAGVDVFSREFRNNTWESLILTGVQPDKIFAGKWLAVLWRVWGWAFALAVFWMSWNIIAFLKYPSTTLDKFLFRVLLWPVIVVVLAILELVCCVSLGVAASAVTRRRSMAAILAGTLRLVPSVFFAIVSVSIFLSNFMRGDTGILYIAFGLSEPSIVTYGLPTDERLIYLVPGLGAAFLQLSGLSIVSLVAGLWSVRRIER